MPIAFCQGILEAKSSRPWVSQNVPRRYRRFGDRAAAFLRRMARGCMRMADAEDARGRQHRFPKPGRVQTARVEQLQEGVEARRVRPKRAPGVPSRRAEVVLTACNCRILYGALIPFLPTEYCSATFLVASHLSSWHNQGGPGPIGRGESIAQT